MKFIVNSRKVLAGRFWLLPLMAFFFVLCISTYSPALAQVAAPPGTCTTDIQFNPPNPGGTGGLTNRLVNLIQQVLNNMTQSMYNGIVNDSGFQGVVAATITLYIAIYGILFTFAMVQMTLFDFAIRMVKVGILILLISGASWNFFNNTVVYFFNAGTDDLISTITQIAIAGQVSPVTPGVPPFQVLDEVIFKAISAKMAVTLLAIFFTGPYGVLFGLLMVMALGSFVRALILAVWVYLMSLVVRTLLFGIAPLFIACLLFNRTRHLFQGWLNQVINACLQPILLFAFYAFFIKLIEAAVDKILNVPVCWTESQESIRGTPFYTHYWRFTQDGAPYGGMWSWTGTDNPGSPIFPIDILDVLIFLLLAELASRFNSVVLMIARDLANATTSLADMQGALSEWMSPVKGRKGGTPGDIGKTETTVPRRAAGGSAAYTSAEGGTAAGGEASAISQARGQAFPPGGSRG